MKTAILIDSGCDVSHELIQRFHMKVMHLHIIYPERDYVDGWRTAAAAASGCWTRGV